MPPRYDDVHRVFAAVCDLTGEARSEALARACGGDGELRALVEALLSTDASGSGLGAPDAGLLHARSVGEAARPERIGPFTIEGVLGAGGMGVVYRARQDKPAREVALKVLAPGFGSAAARRRFEFEAEALGRLQHPGIAQIYAAGSYASPFGEQPYLAMELVRGEPLDAWAARHRRDTRRCVELLVALAEAVHHAHQKGLIHRDLKPGNVLVDAAGQPKVLDFGIARAAEQSDTLTRTGQVVGTLAYMSPEQADGDLARVDVRADVYSLGALGYQVLSGRLPIDVADMTLSEGLRRVTQLEPAPLEVGDASLRSDLAVVFAMALRKEPERRYGSAQELADDLRRGLRSEPVRARAASTGYLLSRFARRHALWLSAAALVFVALAAALVVSLRATSRAEQARGAAEASAADARRQGDVKDLVVQFLIDAFVESDPSVNPSARKEAPGERLARAAARVSARLQADAATALAVHFAVGRTLVGLGDYARATQQLRQADALAGEAPARAVLDVLFELAQAEWSAGELPAALATLGRIDALLAAAPSSVELRVRAADLRGQVLFRQGHVADAERLWQEALRLAAETDHDRVAVVANLQLSLAGAMLQRGASREADELLARVLTAVRGVSGARSPQVLQCLNSLANAAYARGDLQRAKTLFAQVRETWSEVYGDEHPHLIGFMQNEAAIEARLGDPAVAAGLFERALALGERVLGTDAIDLVGPLANLGKLRWDAKRLDEAAALYERAIAIRLATSPGADKVLSGYYYDLARIRRDQGDQERYLELLQRSLVVRSEALGEFHELVLPRRVELANVLLQRGAAREASAELDAIDAQVVAVLGEHSRAGVAAARLAAQANAALGDAARARERLAVLRARAAGTDEQAAVTQWAAQLEQTLGAK